MDPLTFHINALTSGQTEAYKILLTAECAEIGIKFVYEYEFGFTSESYPDDPFKSLASLVMLIRVQSWLELDFEAANLLMTALYRSDLDNLSFIESEQQFSMRMARAIIETSQVKELVIHHSELTPKSARRCQILN